MKVVNHNKNNFYHDSDGFVIRGTIYMNWAEYGQAEKMLTEKYEKAKKHNDTYIRDSLSYIRFIDDNGLVNMGVTATQLVFYAFNLPRYKHQNYMVVVK